MCVSVIMYICIYIYKRHLYECDSEMKAIILMLCLCHILSLCFTVLIHFDEY